MRGLIFKVTMSASNPCSLIASMIPCCSKCLPFPVNPGNSTTRDCLLSLMLEEDSMVIAFLFHKLEQPREIVRMETITPARILRILTLFLLLYLCGQVAIRFVFRLCDGSPLTHGGSTLICGLGDDRRKNPLNLCNGSPQSLAAMEFVTEETMQII